MAFWSHGGGLRIQEGHLRARCANAAFRDVLIYARDHRCSRHVEVNADGFGLTMSRLSDVEGKFVCQVCGKT